MFVALTVFLFIFSIFLHELGHALYMRKYGVEIKTFSVGLPFPLAIKFRSRRIFNGALLQFTPFLLGAYVQPTEKGADRMKDLSYYESADIYGAGPLANFLFAFASVIGLALYLNWGHLTLSYFLDTTRLVMLISLVVFSVYPRLFCRYLVIPSGLFMAGLLIWSIIQSPGQSVVGPVGIVKMIGQSSDITRAILMAAGLSLSVGLFNTLPLLPLDGGHVVNRLLRGYPRLQDAFTTVTTFVFLSLLIFAIISDF